MTRFSLAILCGLVCLTPARSQTAEIQGKLQTARYVLQLQTKEGGFLPAKAPDGGGKAKPSLRATTAAVRAVKYLGVKLPFDREAAAKFVERCYDKASGGFADTPGGKPDVVSTAVALMAVVALDMPVKDYRKGAVAYLAEHVQTFDDIRIAVAGLESIQAVSLRQDEWLEQVIRKRNLDGTWGKGPGAARETGSAIVAVLRMKGPVVQRQNVLKTLQDGQRPDGGFGKADAEVSDLETTYRVMRAFVMLQARPENVEGVRSFVAKCRNDDHGYGVTPEQPSSVGATYYAAIINHWLAKE
jgi:prenyltransferase beta subunit